ncbi:MAG: histidine phosphatase family protein [Candidatus Uhrbacteria bacterium]
MRHGQPGLYVLSMLGEMQVMASSAEYLSDTIFDAAYHSGKARTLNTVHHVLNQLGQNGVEIDESPGLDYEWADTTELTNEPSVMEMYHQLAEEGDCPVVIGCLLACSARARMLQKRFQATLEELVLIHAGHPAQGPETNERHVLIASHATVIETLACPTVQLAGFAEMFRYVFVVEPGSRQTDLIEATFLPCPLNRRYDASAH